MTKQEIAKKLVGSVRSDYVSLDEIKAARLARDKQSEAASE